ncbi:MAG: 3-hydroxyacyl-ACP dehydratase FabZ [Acidimicrobiia bacterium]
MLPNPYDILPHRPPFLFVDEVVELVPGERVKARWFVDPEAFFFPGHFPGRPTLPGVIMLEAIAQCGAIGALSTPAMAGKVPLFGGADKVKFRRQVSPGEMLDLEMEFGQLSARAGKGSGRATVGGQLACQDEFLFVAV